ncbi:MAG: hypothetical protein DRG31_05920 [Deltaproteobacteria bacterium]|nr:MAG: hypothetical protein DRG31_05920 [Deltaproteobacteria bacterium]
MKRIWLLFLLLPLAAGAQTISIPPVWVPSSPGVTRSLSGPYVEVGPVGPGAAKALRLTVAKKLEALNWKVRPLQKGTLQGDPVEAARTWALGQRAPFAMLVILYRWIEREGSDFGVERPAEVAFELALIRTRPGRLLWVKLLKERQRSLSEDLLKLGRFLRKGPKWLKAEELAEALLEEALRGHCRPSRW